MSGTYEPGRLCVATVRGEPDVRVMRAEGPYWVTPTAVGGWVEHNDMRVTDVRPLVVLDLDKVYACDAERDPAAVVRYLRGTGSAVAFAIADQIEAQTRPPKPAEPTGLGAVVEDGAGCLFVRTASDVIPWLDADDTENGYDYADIDAVRVLSEGVKAGD